MFKGGSENKYGTTSEYAEGSREPTMKNTKGPNSRNQPQQDNQSKGGQQCHEGSADVVGNSLNVNVNDVRNQNRPNMTRRLDFENV